MIGTTRRAKLSRNATVKVGLSAKVSRALARRGPTSLQLRVFASDRGTNAALVRRGGAGLAWGSGHVRPKRRRASRRSSGDSVTRASRPPDPVGHATSTRRRSSSSPRAAITASRPRPAGLQPELGGGGRHRQRDPAALARALVQPLHDQQHLQPLARVLAHGRRS